MRALIISGLAVGAAALVFGERPKEPTAQPFPVNPIYSNSYQPASVSDALDELRAEREANDALVEANYQARQLDKLQEEVRLLKAQQSLTY